MILLAVYAVAVCLLVARHRRRPLGYVLAAVGALIPMLVLSVLRRLVPPGEDVSPVSLTLIFQAESAILLVMGTVIASMPRPVPKGTFCKACRYNLTGLNLFDLNCPECGQDWRGPGSGHEEPPRIPIPRGPIKRRPHL